MLTQSRRCRVFSPFNFYWTRSGQFDTFKSSTSSTAKTQIHDDVSENPQKDSGYKTLSVPLSLCEWAVRPLYHLTNELMSAVNISAVRLLHSSCQWTQHHRDQRFIYNNLHTEEEVEVRRRRLRNKNTACNLIPNWKNGRLKNRVVAKR